VTADLPPVLLPEKAVLLHPGSVGWAEKGKLDRGSLAGSHHHCLSLLFTPGNTPDPGPFFPIVTCHGSLWMVWDQQNRSLKSPLGKGTMLQQCLCPTNSWTEAREGPPGR